MEMSAKDALKRLSDNELRRYNNPNASSVESDPVYVIFPGFRESMEKRTLTKQEYENALSSYENERLELLKAAGDAYERKLREDAINRSIMSQRRIFFALEGFSP